MPNRICLIRTSTETRKQATRLAEGLLAERLAACVQIIPAGESLYRWQGAVERSPECYLAVKTQPELRAAVCDWLAEHHPYDTPEILSQEMEANPDYARWVKDETRPHGGGTP